MEQMPKVMIDEMDAKRRAREFIDRTGGASAYRDGKWAEIRRSAALE
jgi:hypothetical protein